MNKSIYIIGAGESDRFEIFSKYYARNEAEIKRLVTQSFESEDSEIRAIDVDFKLNQINCEYRESSEEDWEPIQFSFIVFNPTKKTNE